jgi:3'-5' exoribonuclease
VKKQFVADLKEGEAVSAHFLVKGKEVRTSPRSGKSWLELNLADRTGSIAGKMWDNFEIIATKFERDDVIRVRARVKLYNGERELTLEQIVPATETEYDLADYLPHTKYDVEKLYSDLCAAIAACGDPWIKQLLLSVVNDSAIAAKLKRAPAAMTMHHAYLGGLLEHVVSLIGLSKAVAEHYPELDADLLLAGIMLHDIGKIDELHYARGIGYSTEGRLVGHITMGAMLVREKVQAIPNFPARLAVLVEHLILSHHGSLEFGSPALPQTPEAIALHFLDDLDSKLAAIRSSLDAPSADKDWTDRNPALRRSILRAKNYLAADKTASNAKPRSTTAPKSEVQKA